MRAFQWVCWKGIPHTDNVLSLKLMAKYVLKSTTGITSFLSSSALPLAPAAKYRTSIVAIGFHSKGPVMSA